MKKGGKSGPIRDYVDAHVNLRDIQRPSGDESPSQHEPVTLEIPWPANLRNGARLNADKYDRFPFVGAWYQRVDVWVTRNTVHVALCKAAPTRASMDLPGTQGWLRDLYAPEKLAAMAAKAAEVWAKMPEDMKERMMSARRAVAAANWLAEGEVGE